MNKTLPLLLVALAAGCSCTPQTLERPDTAGKPWDTTYLIDADPSAVTDADLVTRAKEISDHYWTYNQVEGVIWPGKRSSAALEFPDQYGTGGDSALFTGMATLAFCLEYAATDDAVAKDRAMGSLRGLYWVTHAAGRGVIARCAFPIADGAKWGYPSSSWSKYPDYMKPGPALAAPFGPDFPDSFYYTRATRDQFTGLMCGLSAAWVFLEDVPKARDTVAQIMQDLRDHLLAYNWKIRNADGKNDTSADDVDGMLRLQFEALYRHTVTITDPTKKAEADQKYLDWFHTTTIADLFNRFNNYEQYFAHNLRITRALSIWLLEDDATRRSELGAWAKKAVWKFTHAHQNAYFAAVMGTLNPGSVDAENVLKATIRSMSLKPLRGWGSPYGGQEYEPELGDILLRCEKKWVLPPHLRKPSNYWTWQKRPWDVGGPQREDGSLEQPGIDFLVPYWLGRWAGMLP